MLNVADKSYLEMIRNIPSIYDFENPALELKFETDFSKLVDHYDTLTPAEEAEAVKFLMGKIDNPAVFNWPPVFNEIAKGSDFTVPVGTVDDFSFVLNSCFEDARWAKSRAVSYRYAITGMFNTHFGEAKVSLKEKTQTNQIKNSVEASNASVAAGSTCTLSGKNNHSNANCRTRTSEVTNNQNQPYIGSEAHGRLDKAAGARDWIPYFKELQALMSKAGQSSGPSSSAVKPSKPSKERKSKGMYVNPILPIKHHIATSPNLLPVVLAFSFQEEAKGSINLDALLDTGCLAGDFVARRIVDKYDIKPVI